MEINRSDLIKIIADKCPQLETSDVESAVKCILDTMTDTLADGGNIEIRGFGSFKLHYRAARIGRNPKSGEKIKLAGKCVPHFKPGKDLRNRVNSYKSPKSSKSNRKPKTKDHLDIDPEQVEAALTEALRRK